ncbi:MAG: hypothetical protein JF616_20215 [Fibrobacteres bacterium]|nr:hypothetical protein [Fibrobacterota bacterium]
MRFRPKSLPRGPLAAVSGALRILIRLFGVWSLCQCSLSLEDPAQEAKDKLAKVIPTSMDLMIGRWIGDSTYTADDTRATRLGKGQVRLEILSDTSFTQSDTGKSAFPEPGSEGVFYLHIDTLILFPMSAPPDTFVVHLRFLGNYLEIFRVSEQRYTFFHKVKPPGPQDQDSLLADSLWALRGHRAAPGIYQKEALVRDFAYLSFRSDSMFSDQRNNGVVRTDSGPLARDGRHWTWKAGGGSREFLADFPSPDSLRLWPFDDSIPDSGFYDYVRASRHDARDIDMRRLLGHLRGDTLKAGAGSLEYHYGRYYDWILGVDHSAKVETNIDGVPHWSSWTLDSGFLALAEAGHPAQRMRVDTAGGRVHLLMDTGAYFPAPSVYAATLVQGDFTANPLARFDKASYFELKIGGDSLFYFFSESNQRDRFEIYAGPSETSPWMGFALPKAQETFQSGQAGFYLALNDSTRSLGRFTCRSRPDQNLAIRQTAADPLFAEGFIQGDCAIQKADSAFSDSSLSIEGSFKMLRIDRGGFQNKGWNLP